VPVLRNEKALAISRGLADYYDKIFQTDRGADAEGAGLRTWRDEQVLADLYADSGRNSTETRRAFTTGNPRSATQGGYFWPANTQHADPKIIGSLRYD
jgi:hypothetical protein